MLALGRLKASVEGVVSPEVATPPLLVVVVVLAAVVVVKQALQGPLLLLVPAKSHGSNSVAPVGQTDVDWGLIVVDVADDGTEPEAGVTRVSAVN